MESKISGSKYMELAKWINEQIQQRELLPGQKMYSENELQKMFGVSRQTVRHAIRVLEQEGIVRSVRGSGTYVNDDRKENLTKKMRVAVVTTYVDGYIFPRMLRGIENVLLDHGCTVQIAFTYNQSRREKQILEDLLDQNEIAGLIMETTKSAIPNPNLYLFREFEARHVPVLFLNSFYPGLDIPHVSMDDYSVGYKMTKYLISMGHRRIGGIFKLDDLQGRIRYSGYMDAMSEAGLEIDEAHILWLDTDDIHVIQEQRQRVLNRAKGCSALFCYNDEVAYGVLGVFREAGIRVPEDLSITGVDNADLASIGETGITTLSHPMEALGQKASENLIRMIHDPFFDANYEFDVEIVPRDSVCEWKGD